MVWDIDWFAALNPNRTRVIALFSLLVIPIVVAIVLAKGENFDPLGLAVLIGTWFLLAAYCVHFIRKELQP